MKWKAEGPMYYNKDVAEDKENYLKNLSELEMTGISRSETFSLDNTIVLFMLPRLKLLLKYSEEIILADERHADIRKMIEVFETWDKDWFDSHDLPEFHNLKLPNSPDEYDNHAAAFKEELDKSDYEEWTAADEAKKEEALDLLRKHFRSLGW